MNRLTVVLACGLVWLVSNPSTFCGEKAQISLSGKWLFSPDDDERFREPDHNDTDWGKVNVPGDLRKQKLKGVAIRFGDGWYRYHLRLEEGFTGKDLILDLGVIGGESTAYFNGALIGKERPRRGTHWYLVPAALAKSESVIAVNVRSRDGIRSGKPNIRIASGKERERFLDRYMKEKMTFAVEAKSLIDLKREKPVLSVKVENPGRYNPLTDDLALKVVLTTKGADGSVTETKEQSFGLKAKREKALSFDLKLQDEQEVTVGLLRDTAIVTEEKFICLDVQNSPLPWLVAEIHGRWMKDRLMRRAIVYWPREAKTDARTLAKTDRDSLKIVSFTDTVLWDDYFMPNRERDGFAHRFAQGLGPDLKAEVVDAGLSGLSIHGLTKVSECVIDQRPDLVLISFGEHEIHSTASLEIYQLALKGIVDQVRLQTTAAVVLITPPPDIGSPEITQPYIDYTLALAKEKGLRAVSSGEAFKRSTPDTDSLYTYNCPNEKAHRLIAEALSKLISKGEATRLLTREDYVTERESVKGQELVWIDDDIPVTGNQLGEVEWHADVVLDGQVSHSHPASQKPASHGFQNGGPLMVGKGETIVQHVYLDPNDTPKQVMIELQAAKKGVRGTVIEGPSGALWNHRIYWGEDLLKPGKGKKGAEHLHGGALPEAGKWVKLEISAESLGLEELYLRGARFHTTNGKAYWDKTVKVGQAGEVVWFTDGFPIEQLGELWRWDTENKSAGARSHGNLITQANCVSRHAFTFRDLVTLPQDGVILQDVYLSDEEKPEKIELGFGLRRVSRYVYWGQYESQEFRAGNPDLHPYRRNHFMGPLPPTGEWVTLEIPVDLIDLGGARINYISFGAMRGRALWDKTSFRGEKLLEANQKLKPSYLRLESWRKDLCFWPYSSRIGNVFFGEGRPYLKLALMNNTPNVSRGQVSYSIADFFGEYSRSGEIPYALQPGETMTSRLEVEDAKPGFYTATFKAEGASARRRELRPNPNHLGYRITYEPDRATTTLALLAGDVNLRNKTIFMYENSPPVPGFFRLMHAIGTKWARSMTVNQKKRRIDAFNSIFSGVRGGAEPLVATYKRARAEAEKRPSNKFRRQHWFLISSNEMNLNWHNLERWVEEFKAVTLGLKAGDPDCVVSTPEINSIAWDFMEKLGENGGYDYLDLYFTYGCSLPVPPEWKDKYWSFDIYSLAEIEERFGRRFTLTGMQYSTGTRGRAWGIPECHQAAYYVRGDIMRRAYDVDYIAYFKFRECPNVNIYEVKDAIIHYDVTPKPAYIGICNSQATLDGAEYLGKLSVGRGIYGFLFRNRRGLVLALWTTAPIPQKLSLDLHSREITLVDMMGGRKKRQSANGLFSLPVDGNPFFVEGLGAGIFDETIFEAAPIFDKRPFDLARRKDVFLAVEHHRRAKHGWGTGRGDRGDMVVVAGGKVDVRVNVYNFGEQAISGQISLELPEGLVDRTGSCRFELEPISAAALSFSVDVPLDAPLGLGKIKATGSYGGSELDPFYTDILVLSPLDVKPVIGPAESGAKIPVQVTNPSKKTIKGTVKLSLPVGWKAAPEVTEFEAQPEGKAIVEFSLVAARPLPYNEYDVLAEAEIEGKTIRMAEKLDFASIVKTAAAPRIDGKLDDWYQALPMRLTKGSDGYIYNSLASDLTPEKFSVVNKFMYDDRHLYYACDVWDNEICCEDTKHNRPFWDMDSCRLQIDLDRDGKADGIIDLTPTGRSYFDYRDERSDRHPMIAGSKGLVEFASTVYREGTTHPRGYVIETAIPWSYFEGKDIAPSPGLKIGVKSFFVDEDVRGWAEHHWKWDKNEKGFIELSLAEPKLDLEPKGYVPPKQETAITFTKRPGEYATGKAAVSGVVTGPYVPGDKERFDPTGLDVAGHEQANRVWFYGPGYLEYHFVLEGLPKDKRLKRLEFLAELASCFSPGNSHFAFPGNPSEVTLSVNGKKVGTHLSPGDPGSDGWLVCWQVTESGSFLGGKRVSTLNLADLVIREGQKLKLRLAVEEDARSRGGLNVHSGNGSGVHGRDLTLRLCYED